VVEGGGKIIEKQWRKVVKNDEKRNIG